MISNFYYKACLLLSSMNYGNSVPIDYCLHPLNMSDCKLKPTPVFYYYKPGSRCEIQMWRGCPTFNKFDTEFLCSHHCIGKLWDTNDDSSVELKLINSETDECRISMNEDDCGIKDQFKYTYIGDLCIRVAWKGCESRNIFDDEETCVKTCNPQTNYDVDLKHQLEQLPMEDVIAINDILDNIMLDNATRGPIQQLKLNKTTTEAQTTTEVELTTQTVEATTVAKNELVETTTVAVKITSVAAEMTSVVEITIANETTIAEETTVTEITMVTEETTAAEETTVVEETTTAKETTIAEKTTIAKETTVADETTIAKETTVEATTEAVPPDTTIKASQDEHEGSAEEVITT